MAVYTTGTGSSRKSSQAVQEKKKKEEEEKKRKEEQARAEQQKRMLRLQQEAASAAKKKTAASGNGTSTVRKDERGTGNLEHDLAIVQARVAPYSQTNLNKQAARQQKTESYMDMTTANEGRARAGIEMYKAKEDAKQYVKMNKVGARNYHRDTVERSVKGYEESYQRWKKVYDANKGPAAIDPKTSRQSEIRAQAQKIQRQTDTGTRGKDAQADDNRWAGVTDRLKHLGSMQRNVDTPGAKKNYSEEFHPDQVRKQYREAYEQAFPSGQTAKQTSVTDRYSAAEQKLRGAERDAYYWEQAARDAAWFGDADRFTRSLPHIVESSRRVQGALPQFRQASDELAGAVREQDEKLKQGDLATWYARNLTDEQIRRRLEEEKSRDVSVTDRDRAEHPGMYPDAAFRTMPRQSRFDPTMTTGVGEPGNRFYMTEEEKQLTEQSDRYLLQQKVDDREVQVTALQRALESHHVNDLEDRISWHAGRGELPEMAQAGREAFARDASGEGAAGRGVTFADLLDGTVSPEAMAQGNAAGTLATIQRNLLKCSSEQAERVYAMYAIDPQSARELSQKYYDDATDEYYARFYRWASSDKGWQGGRRAVAALLGTGAKLLSGLGPFGDSGQDLSRTGEAFISGGAASASRNGIFGIEALGGDESPISSAVPYIGRGRAGEAYQLGTSVLESAAIAAPAMLMGRYDTAAAKVASFLGTTLMGSSAAADDYRECLSLGMSDSQALWHAACAGVAEGAFEHWSLDKLIDPANIKHGLLRMLTQGGIEASEEVCTTIANRISDTVLADLYGTRNAIEREALEYQLHGMSAEEAEEKAQNQWLAGLMMDGLGGLFSGIIMGGGSDILQRGIARLNTTINTAEENTGRGYLTGLETAGYTDTDTLDALTGYARANGIDVKGLTDAQAKAAVSDQGAVVSVQETQGAETGNSQEAIGNSGRETTDRAEDGTPLIRQPEGLTPSPEGEGITEDEGRGTETQDEVRRAESARPTETKDEGRGTVNQGTVPQIDSVNQRTVPVIDRAKTESEEKPRLSKRDLRKAGKVRAQIVESLSSQFEGKTAAEQAAVYDSLVESYGSGIEAAASEALYNESRKAMQSARSVPTLEQQHGTDAAAFQSETAQQAVARAYRDTQSAIMRDTGDTTQSSVRSLQAATKRAGDGLTMQAEIEGADGKTQTVDIISWNKAGTKVVLKDGTQVSVDSLQADENTKSFLQAMEKAKLGSYADEAFQTYLTSGARSLADGYSWIMGYRNAFGVGEVKGSVATAVQQAARYGVDMETAAAAYYNGVMATDAISQAAKQELSRRLEISKKGVTGERGSVRFASEAIQNKVSADADLREFVDDVIHMAEFFGVPVTMTESKQVWNEKLNKYVYEGSQGSHQAGSIEIDINAGKNFVGDAANGILQTFGHEMTHFTRYYNEDGYVAIRDFATGQIVAQEGQTHLEELIRRQMESHEGDESFTRDDAIEEVVAEFCQDMLTNKTALETFAKESPKGFKAFVEWIKNFLSRIREKLAKSPAATNERAIYQKMEDNLKDVFGKLWAKEVMGAVRVHDAVNAETQTETESKEKTAQGGGKKYQLHGYSQQQIDNWSDSNKIVIYSGDESVKSFLSNIHNEKTYSGKLYFGEIGHDLGEAIRMATGYDFEGKNVSLLSDDVRYQEKIAKIEGTDELTEKDYCRIPSIIGEPEIIHKAVYFKNKNVQHGVPAATFEKTIGDTEYSLFVVNGGPKSTDVFVKKTKKGSIANVPDGTPPGPTSETLVGTTPNDSIPDVGIIVNRSNKNYTGQPTITMGYGENRKTYVSNNETIDFVEAKEESKLYLYDNNKKDITGPISEFYKQFQHGEANQDNFYSNTIAEFEGTRRRPKGAPDYVSRKRNGEISSEYWYKNDGVIRGSDHWGANIASCSWFLNNSEKSSGKRYGFAKWSDFVQKTEIITSEDGRATITTFENTIGAEKGRFGESIPIVRGYNDKKNQARIFTLTDLEGYGVDSIGRELSEGQQEYFKDSKAVDKDGNLLVLYRGKRGGETVIHGDYRGAIWTTTDPEFADRYGVKDELYANIKNPYYKTVYNTDSDTGYDIDQVIHAAKSGGHDGAIISFELNPVVATGYVEFAAKNYPNEPASEILKSWAKSSYMDAHEGETIAEFWKRANEGPVSQHVVVFDSAQIKRTDNKNPTTDTDIRYQQRDYEAPADVDLVMGMDEKDADTPEGKALIREVQAKQKQIEALQEKLAEAKRQLSTTKRALNTKGIGNVAGNVIRDFGISDAGGKNIRQQATAILTEAYQKALDQIDSGATAADAWATVYNAAVEAAELLIDQGRYTENQGGKWTNVPYSRYIGESRQMVIDQMVSEAAVDFSRNRYRGPIQETAADRLVARTEKRMQGKLDETKANNAELKAENERLAQDKAFLQEQAESARFAAGNLFDQVKDLRQELKDNRKLTAQERKSLQGKIDRLNRQIEAKRTEAAAWRDRANRNASLLKSALESKSRDIQAVKDESQRQVDRAVAEKEAAVRKLEAQIEREQRILAGKLKPPAMQKMLKDMREAAWKERNERISEIREQRKAAALRSRIKNLHAEMQRTLLKPKEGHYVPQDLVRPVIDLLEMIDSNKLPQDIENLQKRIDAEKNPDKREALEERMITLKDRQEKASVKINAISAAYARMKGNENTGIYYDESVEAMLLELGETVKGKTIYEMNSDELSDVFTVMKAMNTTIRNAVKADLVEKGRNIFEIGTSMIDELRNSKGAHRLQMLESWHKSQLSPLRAFKRFGGYMPNSTWLKMYDMLNNAQNQTMWLEMQGTRIFDDVLGTKADRKLAEKLSSTDEKDMVDVGLKDARGNSVKITRGMMLSLYMHMQNEDNMRHIMYGGISLPGMKQYYGKKSGDAWGSAKTRIPALGVRVSNLEQLLETLGEEGVNNAYKEQEQAVREMFDSVRQKIEKILTPYDRRWIAASKKFFDDFSRRELNKATMAMYGFNKASVDNYFPITSDPAFLKTDIDSIKRDASLENAGFMKARVKAGNPILLEDITKAVNRQITKVAQYAGMTQALKTFDNVYKVQQKGYADSVKEALRDKFEAPGQKYVENLLSDLVGGRSQESTLFDKIKGHYAQAVLSVNAPVTVKQAASFPTALPVVGWKALAKALAAGGKSHLPISRADRALIDTYTPLLWKRAQGAIDVELGDVAKGRDWTQKASWLMGWIQKTDLATVGRLWSAAEYYVRDNFKSLEKGTTEQIKKGESEYYRKVAEIFNRIVEETQPNYSVMQRPDILRNPNKLLRAVTMFSTQRLQNANILIDALGEYNAMRAWDKNVKTEESKAARKTARVNLVNAIASQAISTVVLNLMTFAGGALLHRMNPWRDDDDELTMEGIREEFLDGILSTFSGSFLWGSDAYDALHALLTDEKYYKGDVGGVSTMYDFIDSTVKSGKALIKLLKKDDKSWEDAKNLAHGQLYKTAEYLSQMAGVPLGNIKKILDGAYYHGVDILNKEFFSFEAGLKRANSTNARRFTKAWNAKDEAKMDKVLDEMFGNKVRTSDAAEGARDALSAAAKEAYQAGKMDMEEYVAFLKRPECFTDKGITSRITDRLKEDFIAGKRSAEETVELLLKYKDYKKNPEQSAWSAVKEWAAKAEFEKENGEDADDDDFSFSQYDELNDAVAADENVTAEIQELKAHGYTDKQINDALQDSIKKAFKDGTYTEEEAIDALVRYGATYSQNGKTVAFDKDKAWQTVREWAAKAGHEDEEGHLEEGYSYSLYDGLREAVTTGKGIEAAMKELTDHGVKASAVNDELNKTVLKLYTDGEISEKTAIGLLTKYHTVTKNKQTRLQTADEAWAALREASAKAAHTDEDGHLEDDYSYNKYEKIDAALDKNGDISKLVKELTDHGEKQENITKHVKSYLLDRYVAGQTTEKALKNQLSRYCGITKTDEVEKILKDAGCEKDCGYGFDELKNAYGRGDLSEATAKKMLRKYGGLTDSGAAHRIGYWDYCRKNPDTQIKAEAWDTYYEKQLPTVGGTLSSRGMKLSSFTEYREKRAQLEVTDLDGDGKKDEKAYVLNLINSMKLSTAEKDMLYYYNGYGARELWKTPWH